jgi:ABC-type xylose transport system permease subunit
VNAQEFGWILKIFGESGTLLGINSYYQQIVKGVILLLALVFDLLTSQKESTV